MVLEDLELLLLETLYSLGNDVLVIDTDEDVVQEISDNVTHAVQMDATDENALKNFRN